MRLGHHLPSKLFKLGLHSAVSGVTENVSAGGALIKTREWDAFQPDDHTVVTFYIPPTVSGLDRPIASQSFAVVTRVDKMNMKVAVKFGKVLKEFEEI
jgi:hypothetical protein